MSETSSPEVIPAITKADALALRQLVRADTKILLEGIELRRDDFWGQVNDQCTSELAELQTVKDQRDADDAKVRDTNLAKIERRLNGLNVAIVETMTELRDAGWGYGYGYSPIDPHSFAVAMPNTDRLRPPERDDSELDEQIQAVQNNANDMTVTIQGAYQVAKRGLETQEAGVAKELVLQSITTEMAREFVVNMPNVENVLPAPEGLVAIESA